MTVSEKQLAANRCNALKSTGPRTEDGKSISSKNALTHGLRAADVVIPSEDPSEFDSFRLVLLNDLAPIGQLEVMLADRIISSFWKLKRSGRMENELYAVLMDSEFSERSAGNNNKPFDFRVTGTNPDGTKRILTHSVWTGTEMIDKMEAPKPDVSESTEPHKTLRSLGSVALEDFTSSNILSRFRRYESQIERSLYRSLKELHRYQWLRKRENLIINDDEQ